MEDAQKTCPKCQQTKPLDGGFYKLAPNPSSGYKGGYSSWCRECQLADKRKPRQCLGCGAEYYRVGSGGSRRRVCDDCAKVGRVCARCNQFKPLDRFYDTAKGRGGSPYCRDGCTLRANREYRYKIEPGGYEVLLQAEQDGCLICGSTGRRMTFDHRHSDGKFRAVICSKCNSGLGMFDDSVESLLGAVAYLKKHSAAKI